MIRPRGPAGACASILRRPASARPLSRRSLLACAAAAAAGSALRAAPARAEDRYLDIRPGGNFNPVLIAVTPFAGEGGDAAKVASIISNDFKRCVYIKPLDGPQPAVNPDAPAMESFKSAGAQFVLTGRVDRGGGRLNTDFRLFDASSGQQVAGQHYTTDPSNSRRVAHIVADAVFTRITGEKGFFDSRVVFVDETGSAEKRRKRLAIADQDGGNVHYLTHGDNLVVTPRFSPSAQQVAYMAFGDAEPEVMLLNVETGARQSVGNFPGMTFSPRFSPDGRKIVMSLSDGPSANLYTMPVGGSDPRQLTSDSSIDTSPCYSPDGSQIVFESDRGGTQQIYVMGAAGGGAKRISFGDGRYSTPVWSPKGDYIAFTKQSGGQFAIGIMKPDGSGEKIITQGFHNEGPTWAPNGLYLMFFRDAGNGAASKVFMTDLFGRGEFPVPTPGGASDPAWGPLLG